jgi:glycosyltransferase involved in cell wall biosynthesis
MLQEFYKEHNVAVREYATERPDLLWLHWIHSCPTSVNSSAIEYPENCRYTPPPGYLIYPNDTDKPRVCQAYQLSNREWKVIPCRAAHAIDPLLIWPYDKLTVELATKADLLSGDIVAVYPARLDKGKQPEKIIRLMAGVKNAGLDPRLLVIDWQSTGHHFQAYIDNLMDLSRSLLIENGVNFTSRLDDRCSQGVPRRVVSELMDLSNVYIHPSRVETYSLVVHEAILRGCLTVLNYDFYPMRELYQDNAIYMDFGSDRVNRTYEPDEQAFWNDEALRLVAEVRQNRAVMAKTTARRQWSPQALWKEFEPLLYLQPVGE